MKKQFGKQSYFLRVVLAAYIFVLPVACAVEVENPDNPNPISPKPSAGSKRSGGEPDSASGASGQSTTSVPIPTFTCTVNISRGAANSSGKDGAVIALPETDTYENSDLLFRTYTTASFLEVKEQVFNSGTFSTGEYSFEFRKPDGNACKVPVTITSDDILNKVKLTLEIDFPN